MKTADYPIFLIYSTEDEAWLARVDQLPGCVVDGQTPEEALKNAQAAIEDWIETAKELGRSVPEPFTAEKLEEVQAEAIQKHQELLQSAFQQAMDEALRQVQQSPKNQTLAGLAHHYGTQRGVMTGIAQIA